MKKTYPIGEYTPPLTQEQISFNQKPIRQDPMADYNTYKEQPQWPIQWNMNGQPVNIQQPINPYSYDPNSPLHNMRVGNKLRINGKSYYNKDSKEYNARYQTLKNHLQNTDPTIKQGSALLSNYLTTNPNFNHLNLETNRNKFPPGVRGNYSAPKNKAKLLLDEGRYIDNPFALINHELGHAYSKNYDNWNKQYNIKDALGVSNFPDKTNYQAAQNAIDKTRNFSQSNPYEQLIGRNVGQHNGNWDEDEYIARAIQHVGTPWKPSKNDKVDNAISSLSGEISQDFKNIVPQDQHHNYQDLFNSIDRRKAEVTPLQGYKVGSGINSMLKEKQYENLLNNLNPLDLKQSGRSKLPSLQQQNQFKQNPQQQQSFNQFGSSNQNPRQQQIQPNQNVGQQPRFRSRSPEELKQNYQSSLQNIGNMQQQQQNPSSFGSQYGQSQNQFQQNYQQFARGGRVNHAAESQRHRNNLRMIREFLDRM